MIPYQLVRSKRKTIAICITKDAQVEVRAPLRAPISSIEGFLIQKESWIETQLKQRKQELEKQAAFSVEEGDHLLFLGREYPVHLSPDCEKPSFDGEQFLLPQQDFSRNKPLIAALYKSLAQNYIEKQVEVYSRLIGVVPSAVKVGSADTRWGSCSGKNSLNFTWKLMLASKEAVDYVIVHELCHILHHNHSTWFWREVEKVMPDYGERKKLLFKLQKHLLEEGW